MTVRGSAAAVAVAVALLLSGCATAMPLASPLPSTPESATPTPTVACPIVEGQDLPPQCFGYDPDHAMDQNERYRERVDLDEVSSAGNEDAAAAAQAALEEVRAGGAITVDTVGEALGLAGLESARIREDHNRVLFGVGGPAGGCIYGEVSEASVSVNVGGFILDGGCLPAQ